MRQIGSVASEKDARRFEDYALTLGIKTRIDPEDDGWAVWVYDEDRVAQGKEELARFQENPGDPRYTEASRAAGTLRRDDERESEQHRKNVVDVRERWNRPLWMRCPITYAMIAFSALVVLVSTDWETPFRFCDKLEPLLKFLFIVPGEAWAPRLGLEAIWSGQVWRLFTPMFIHFGPLHILFNMLWLRDLGGAIELRRGKMRFVVLVLAVAGLSNLAQYWWSGPGFGGMSGVVFGLFGYVWMKSRFQPDAGFHLPPNVVFLMLLYLAITLAGAFQIPIAHAAHLGGLAAGIVIGSAPILWRKARRPNQSSP